MLLFRQRENARELRACFVSTARECQCLRDEPVAPRPAYRTRLHFGENLLVLAFRQQRPHEKAASEIEVLVERKDLAQSFDGFVVSPRMKERERACRANRKGVGLQLHGLIEGRERALAVAVVGVQHGAIKMRRAIVRIELERARVLTRRSRKIVLVDHHDLTRATHVRLRAPDPASARFPRHARPGIHDIRRSNAENGKQNLTVRDARIGTCVFRIQRDGLFEEIDRL